MEQGMDNLLHLLGSSKVACNYCFNACLQEKDVQMMTKCIKLDKDCAEMCGLALSFVASNSTFRNDVLRLCATICEACAEECGKFPEDHCQQCAKACQECAEACKAFL